MDKRIKAKAIVGLKGGKVAAKTEDGTWGTPKDFKYLTSLSLESGVENTEQYADDERILCIPSDTSMEGSIGTTAQDIAFEEEAGYLLEIDGGVLAEIKTRGYVPFCFYYEYTRVDADTKRPYKVKVWIMNAEIRKTNESHETNQKTPTIAAYSYPITVYGENVKNTEGTAEAIDEGGFPICAYKVISLPGDTGYETFGNTVPTLKQKAAVGA